MKRFINVYHAMLLLKRGKNGEKIKGATNILLWWKCPICHEKIDFYKQLLYVFMWDGEADFDPEYGMFHTIECDCGAKWHVNISDIERY